MNKLVLIFTMAMSASGCGARFNPDLSGLEGGETGSGTTGSTTSSSDTSDTSDTSSTDTSDTSGVHILTWAYWKDGSTSEGFDKVWVDAITVTNAEPI